MICKLYEHIQGIWEVRLTLFFVSVRKNSDRTTNQSDYISGKATKGEILENEAQSQVEYSESEKTSCFEVKSFFQMPLEIFL